jgi:hypothetical protein
MNTGMGDAVNLAWKLAAVVQGRADARLLDSYEPERIAFAHQLVRGTDRAFRLVTSGSRVIGLLRRHVLPRLASLALRTGPGSRRFFGLFSQTAIAYRQSLVSRGSAGKVHGGDRLPWVGGATGDNFEPLASLDWQLHVYGRPSPELRQAFGARGIPLHVFGWSADAALAGLTRDAGYLLRPDGHVGMASASQDVPALLSYLDELAILPRLELRRSSPSRVLPQAARPSTLRSTPESKTPVAEGAAS